MAMTSKTDRTAGEIDWPAWAERTPPGERERVSKFKVPQGRAVSDLEKELLKRVGADDWRLSTAAPHRKSDGLPYANARPDDPGAVVRWTKDGEQYCVACDHYTKVRDNIRTIGLYVEEKRKMSNRPVETGQDEFATARLPPGEDESDGDVVVAEPVQEPHEVLGVSPEAPEPVIRGAFNELVKEAHGDQGNNPDYDVNEIVRARDALLEG